LAEVEAVNHHHQQQQHQQQQQASAPMNLLANPIHGDFWNQLLSMHPSMAAAAVSAAAGHTNPFLGLRLPPFFPYGNYQAPSNPLMNYSARGGAHPAAGFLPPRYWMPNMPPTAGHFDPLNLTPPVVPPAPSSASSSSTPSPVADDKSLLFNALQPNSPTVAPPAAAPSADPLGAKTEKSVLDLRIKIDQN
jgi:hypothetical protein